MTEYASAEALISSTLNEEDLPLPSGKLVRVKGLSRGEVFLMQKTKQDGGIKDEAAWERRMVSLALVAPKLTEEQVGQWQQGPAGGDLQKLTEKIQELSGLAEGADKSSVQDVRDPS